MQALVNAVTQSVMTRFLANIFLFLLVISALGIAGYEIILNQPVNTIILSLLSIGAGNALAILGINHGSTLTPTSLTTPATPITSSSATPAPASSSMQGH